MYINVDNLNINTLVSAVNLNCVMLNITSMFQKTERMLKLELLNQSEIDPDAFILCFMSHGGRFNNKGNCTLQLLLNNYT